MTINQDELTQKEMQMLYEKASEAHCMGSDDEREIDCSFQQSDFSVGDDGVWVKGWMWVRIEQEDD